MNKKQLTLQNASLFAELERRAKDTEILNIRIEEAEQQLKALFEENKTLKNSLEQTEAEKKELYEKIKALETALAEANTIKESVALTTEKSKTAEAVQELSPIDLEISEKISELAENRAAENNEGTEPDAPVSELVTEPACPTATEPDAPAEPDLPTADFEADAEDELITETLIPPTTIEEEEARTEATADLLRDYGAKIIGKVTRVTAEVLSKVGSLNSDATESLKTLALGKNESFKYQIIELARAKGDAERIMSEMDFLADEAIVYLRSI